jgi:hypothetical protein
MMDAKVLEVLKALEWSGNHDWSSEDMWGVISKDICPMCYGRKSAGHKPWCKLYDAIRSLEVGS